MSINDATPAEWDEVTSKVRSYKREIVEPTEPIEDDDVEHPVHYNNGNVECIEAIEAASSKKEFEGYLRGNVIKYIWRFRYKDGEKDLRKAKWYLEKLISFLEKSNVGS
jgi:hypothetical protein